MAEPDLPVVVGVDGTATSETLLEYGFGYAAAHGVALHAVLCWRPDPLDKVLLAPVVTVPDAGFAEQAQSWLSEVLAGWQEKFPTVQLRKYAVESAPTAGLLDLAASARLIIVGTHSRSPLGHPARICQPRDAAPRDVPGRSRPDLRALTNG